MSGVSYDSGALIAAERGSSSIWALHRRLLESGARPTVSTVVLGQAWRGGPQAELSRLLRGCRIEPLSESQARSAGAALAASGGRDVIDAVVVTTALVREDLVVTSDPDDLHRIATAIGGAISIYLV